MARTLEAFANRKVRGALAQLGQELPATVASIASPGTVVVQFQVTNTVYTLPNIEVPIVGSQWVRLPIQVGTPGMVMTADAYLGGMSGIGGGVADLVPRGNLGMLVWVPLGSRNWAASSNPNAVDLNGPDGVIIRDTGSLSKIVLTPTGIDLYPPGVTPAVVHGNLTVTGNIMGANLELSGSIQGPGATPYTGDIHTTGTVTGDTDVVAAGVSGKTHVHSGVTTGSGDSGPPT